MHEPNITRALRIFESTKVSAIEWHFQQESLFFSPDLVSFFYETPQEKHVGLKFFWKHVHPADRVKVAAVLRNLSPDQPLSDLELRLKNRAGEYVWFNAKGKLFVNSQNQPEYLTFSLSDIHEDKSMLERLSRRGERLELASKFAEICLWEVNANYNGREPHRTFWWSESFYDIFEYNRDEIRYKQEDIFNLIHPDDLESMLKDTQILGGNAHSRHPNSIDFEFRVRHKTKGYLWQRCIGFREVSGEGTLRGLGALINVNDLRMAQQETQFKNLELKRMNEELEHFAYAASHDLKAPLRGLKSLAEWIAEDIENPSDSIVQNLHLMRKRVTRMENMLADILAYSKAGWNQNELDHIELQSFISEIWECLHPPQSFELHLELQVPSLKAPKILLEQTFSNLIANAIKHHDESCGNIWIRYNTDEQNHCFSVRDDGPGIDPQFEEKIFRIFQTLHPRDKVEGSGVGLAIVKKNVESLGGAVWLDTEATVTNPTEKKRGSCFNFTLPFDRGRMSNEWKSFELFDNEI